MELGQLVDHFKKSDPMAPYSSAIERELVSAQDKINSGYPEHSKDANEGIGRLTKYFVSMMVQSGFAQASTDNNLWNNLRNNYHSVIVFAGNPNVHADLPDDVNPWRQIFIKARGLFSEKGPILIAATAAHYDEYQELQRILSDYPKSRFKGENKYSLEQHMARVLSGHPYAIHARYIGYSNLPKAA